LQKNVLYEIRLNRCILGRLSAHSYNSLLTGEPLVAEGGRASKPFWGRDQAAKMLNWSNGSAITRSPKWCRR